MEVALGRPLLDNSAKAQVFGLDLRAQGEPYQIDGGRRTQCMFSSPRTKTKRWQNYFKGTTRSTKSNTHEFLIATLTPNVFLDFPVTLIPWAFSGSHFSTSYVCFHEEASWEE